MEDEGGVLSNSRVKIIMTTAVNDIKEVMRCFHELCDDYLVKPFDEQELKARLQVGQRIVNLQKELVEARETMRHAATYDALTGLLNRREIVDFVRRELNRTSRENKPLTVILADIDHFKLVNDQLGHLAGDEVLKEVGRRLKSKLRAYDGVGRYGGEEFLLALPGCDLTSALIRADQIRAQVSQTAIPTGSQARKITLSMGVAVANGEMEPDVQAFLHQADAGLYKAKRNGRNRVEQVDEVNPREFARI